MNPGLGPARRGQLIQPNLSLAAREIQGDGQPPAVVLSHVGEHVAGAGHRRVAPDREGCFGTPKGNQPTVEREHRSRVEFLARDVDHFTVRG